MRFIKVINLVHHNSYLLSQGQYRSKSPSFDVVVLDCKMPQMNGIEVAKEILAVNPHQRIIFASAYTKDTVIDSIKNLKQSMMESVETI